MLKIFRSAAGAIILVSSVVGTTTPAFAGKDGGVNTLVDLCKEFTKTSDAYKSVGACVSDVRDNLPQLCADEEGRAVVSSVLGIPIETRADCMREGRKYGNTNDYND